LHIIQDIYTLFWKCFWTFPLYDYMCSLKKIHFAFQELPVDLYADKWNVYILCGSP